jgi:hypothetical protein
VVPLDSTETIVPLFTALISDNLQRCSDRVRVSDILFFIPLLIDSVLQLVGQFKRNRSK